jgi:hypothetical protein
MGYFPIAAFVFFFLQIYHIRLFLFTVVDNPVDNPNILICYMLITRAYFKLTSPWRVILRQMRQNLTGIAALISQNFNEAWYKKRQPGTFG